MRPLRLLPFLARLTCPSKSLARDNKVSSDGIYPGYRIDLCQVVIGLRRLLVRLKKWQKKERPTAYKKG